MFYVFLIFFPTSTLCSVRIDLIRSMSFRAMTIIFNFLNWFDFETFKIYNFRDTIRRGKNLSRFPQWRRNDFEILHSNILKLRTPYMTRILSWSIYQRDLEDQFFETHKYYILLFHLVKKTVSSIIFSLCLPMVTNLYFFIRHGRTHQNSAKAEEPSHRPCLHAHPAETTPHTT